MKTRRAGWVLLPRGRKNHFFRSTGKGGYVSLCGINVTLSAGPMQVGFPRWDWDCSMCGRRMMANAKLCRQVQAGID